MACCPSRAAAATLRTAPQARRAWRALAGPSAEAAAARGLRPVAAAATPPGQAWRSSHEGVSGGCAHRRQDRQSIGRPIVWRRRGRWTIARRGVASLAIVRQPREDQRRQVGGRGVIQSSSLALSVERARPCAGPGDHLEPLGPMRGAAASPSMRDQRRSAPALATASDSGAAGRRDRPLRPMHAERPRGPDAVRPQSAGRPRIARPAS